MRFVGMEDVRCVVPDLHEVEAVLRREDISRSIAPDSQPQDFCKIGDTLTARWVCSCAAQLAESLTAGIAWLTRTPSLLLPG